MNQTFIPPIHMANSESWETLLRKSCSIGVSSIDPEPYLHHLNKWQSKLFFHTSEDTAVVVLDAVGKKLPSKACDLMNYF